MPKKRTADGIGKKTETGGSRSSKEFEPSRTRRKTLLELNVTDQQLKAILREVGVDPRKKSTTMLRSDLEEAFAQYDSDVADAALKVAPSALRKDLGVIEAAARTLADLLSEKREAQDAMVRAIYPQYDKPTLVASPIAPPHFAGMSVEIAIAAQLARASNSPRPYVRQGRDHYAENRMIENLLVAWGRSFDEPATFSGTSTPSPFVRLALTCFRRVDNNPQSVDALAKRCSRIQRRLRRTEAKKPS